MSFFVSDKISGIVTEDLLTGFSDDTLAIHVNKQTIKVIPDESERNFSEGWLRIKFKTSHSGLGNPVMLDGMTLTFSGREVGIVKSFRMTRRDETSVCEILLTDLNT